MSVYSLFDLDPTVDGFFMRPMRRVRDDKVIDKNTKITQSDYYKNGITVSTNAVSNQAKIVIYTVENLKYTVSAKFTVNAETRKLDHGRVNCFALGWVNAEQDYVDECFAEWEEEKAAAAMPPSPPNKKVKSPADGQPDQK